MIRQALDSLAARARRFGFHPLHLVVVVFATVVSTAAVFPHTPVLGLAGFLVGLAAWLSLIHLTQIANEVLVGRFEDRLPGVLSVELYCVGAMVGLVIVAAQLALSSPMAWGRLQGRFTPEIAVFGVFVVGGLLVVAFGLGKLVYRRTTG